jgi:hypothetical protein
MLIGVFSTYQTNGGGGFSLVLMGGFLFLGGIISALAKK